MSGLRIKNIKFHMLISRKSPIAPNFKALTVNLTSGILSDIEKMQLELGLEQSFIHKNINQLKYLAINLKLINQKVSDEINNDQKENFNEFLCAYTEFLSKM